MDWTPIIVAGVAAAPGIVSLFVQWRKGKADAAHVVTQSALSLIQPQAEQIEKLCARIEVLETENRTFRTENDRKNDVIAMLSQRVDVLETEFQQVLTGAHKLYKQVQEAQLEPVYCPPDRRQSKRKDKDDGE